MKTFKLFFLGLVLFFAGSAQAQISVRFSIGSPPEWAPVQHVQVRYYYLPDVEAYYDVQTSMFIYLDGRSWVHRTYLPYRYRNYNLYSGYKVSMHNYYGHTPYTQYYEQRNKYSKGRNREYQQTIGEHQQRGNYSSSQQYRENNQVNRGRYETAEKYDNRNSHDNRNYNNNGNGNNGNKSNGNRNNGNQKQND